MRTAILLLLSVPIVLILNGCNQKEDAHLIYAEADSLVSLTLALQSWIGSPEIQRLHDFEIEINHDLEFLSRLDVKDSSVTKYMELKDGLGQCLLACTQFHEEAFMLESSLEEIMKKSEPRNANMEELFELLQYERLNYMDLAGRIHSSMTIARGQAEIFYSLKPTIEKIKEQTDTTATQ